MSTETPEPTPVAPAGTPALPTPAAVLQALRAPLIGLAVTFAAAVVLTVLVVVASGIDSSSDLSSDAFHQPKVFLLVPFQMVAMALLGKLTMHDHGLEVTYLLPPLALTFTYLVTVARVARTRAVAADHVARAVLGASVGLVAAALLTLITRVAAVRFEGTTSHAAGVSLFFGTWILTALAVFVGSRHGAGMRWPAFVSIEYAEAIKLWFQHITVWVVVAVPLIALAAGFDEGWSFALLFPLWAVTGGLYTYAIAHFSGISAFDESVGVFDFTSVWTVVALLGTVVVTVITAVVWSVRRNKNPEWLANPTSWTVLPTIYFGAAILVFLIPTASVGGGFEGVGATATVRPSPLIFALLPVFGLVTEFLSRTLGAAVSNGLSPSLAARLRGTPITAPAAPDATGADPVPVIPRAPLTPEERKRWKRVGILGGVVIVLLGGGWITISTINSSSYSAEATAEKYLDAVVAGDFDKALDLAPVDHDAKSDLLTKAVYKSARHTITGYTLGKTESFGGTTTITAHLKGIDGDGEVQLRLSKDGKKDVVFDSWKIEDGGVASKTSFELPEGSDSVSIGDTSVRIGKDGDYWLYPGSYAFNPYGDSTWVEGGGETTVEPGSFGYADFSDAEPTQAFEDEANRQLTAYLDGCMQAKTLETPECPNDSYESNARNVKWTMIQAPTIDFDSFDGTFPADLSVDSGKASVTYEYDQNYGFGPKDYVRGSDDDVDLYLSITVDEDGDNLKFSFNG